MDEITNLRMENDFLKIKLKVTRQIAIDSYNRNLRMNGTTFSSSSFLEEIVDKDIQSKLDQDSELNRFK